jgi:hypothetical protein
MYVVEDAKIRMFLVEGEMVYSQKESPKCFLFVLFVVICSSGRASALTSEPGLVKETTNGSVGASAQYFSKFITTVLSFEHDLFN